MPKPPHQQMFAGFDDADDAASPPAASSSEPDADSSPESSLAGKTVYLVDSHSLIFQVFHAMQSAMSSPSGQPTWAIHGFLRDVLDLLEKKQPDYFFCVFDPHGPTFRKEIYPDYKIDREEMPADLRPQIENIRRSLDAMKIPVLVQDGFEADDVLATVARRAEEAGAECILVTSDKDCRQLITDHVRLYNIRKDEFIDADYVQKDWGIAPAQVIDMQALWGDSTDNVPGVPGIGKKTAAQLLQEYGDLDQVLENAPKIKAKKRRENLIEFRDQALVSRELVTLRLDTPIEVDWSLGRIDRFDFPAAVPLFDEFGFRNLRERLHAGKAPPAAEHEHEKTQHSLVDTAAKFADFLAELKARTRFSVDTETRSITDDNQRATSPRWTKLVGLSFSWKSGEGYYLPLKGPEGDNVLAAEVVLAELKPILEDAAIEKVGQNLKYDIVVLEGAGITMRGATFDTMVAHYLLDAGQRNHGLDYLADKYLGGYKPQSIRELIGSGKSQKAMDEVPVEEIAYYAAEDADIAWRLVEQLTPLLGRSPDLESLFHDVEMPLVSVLADLEFRGVKVDAVRLRELGESYSQKIETLQAEIYAIAGREFNIDSPKQLGEVLFDELGLPVVKKTRTGRSTDVDVLTRLARDHGAELPAKIIEYRGFAKLKSTYVDSLLGLIHPVTKRVHTSFNQVVAATGRLSSNDPNLQNIPTRTEQRREIRSAFLPGKEDWRLVSADYSQVELRVLAHLCEDETLLASFAADEDIHARVASEVHGVPLDEVTPELRRGAKAINFGIIYGQSPFGLAQALDIPREQAAEFIEAYFARYPKVDEFLGATLDFCLANGYVETMFGRRREIRDVRPADKRRNRQLNLSERIAVNTVVQGAAADLIKRAMIAVHRRLRVEELQARMLLQIHDELLLEAPADEVATAGALLREEMMGVAELKTPLKVDVKSGPHWAACDESI